MLIYPVKLVIFRYESTKFGAYNSLIIQLYLDDA